MNVLRTVISRTKNSALKSALFFIALVLVTACSQKTRSLFFDIPPSKPKPEQPAEQAPAAKAQATASAELAGLLHPHDREDKRPPIEDVLNWEEALDLLPKDQKGNPDWVQAQREGTIKPRAWNPRDRNGDWFRLDFYLQNDKPKFEAYFPHSAHVAMMGCDSCHPAIFRYRDNEITMKTMRKGENCGTCHGSVAFSTKNCKRCHTSM